MLNYVKQNLHLYETDLPAVHLGPCERTDDGRVAVGKKKGDVVPAHLAQVVCLPNLHGSEFNKFTTLFWTHQQKGFYNIYIYIYIYII
jgi:hypothetical protein